MRRRSFLLSFAASLSLLASCSEPSSPPPMDAATGGTSGSCPNDLPSNADCSTNAPSYSRVVAAVIEANCLSCHAQGNTLSRVELFDHASVYKNRRLALTQVYQCKMPLDLPLAAEPRATLLKYFVCDAPDN